MTIIILYIFIISVITLGGAFLARQSDRPTGLFALHIIFTALSQIMASKLASFELGFTTVYAPAAVLIFAVTFLITDIVNEKFGRNAVHRMIGITFMTQVVMVVFLWIGTVLPAAPFWDKQAAWESLFGLVPRIVLASWITFLISENLDAVLYDIFRKLTKGKHLWLRNVASTIPALTIDTLIFIPIAFYGTGIPLMPLILGQFATKYMVGIVNIPFMYMNRMVLGPTNPRQ